MAPSASGADYKVSILCWLLWVLCITVVSWAQPACARVVGPRPVSPWYPDKIASEQVAGLSGTLEAIELSYDGTILSERHHATIIKMSLHVTLVSAVPKLTSPSQYACTTDLRSTFIATHLVRPDHCGAKKCFYRNVTVHVQAVHIPNRRNSGHR